VHRIMGGHASPRPGDRAQRGDGHDRDGAKDNPAIRVLLTDDHPIVRGGIRLLLETAPDLVVVGEAGDGMQALQLVSDLAPDILLLDIEMPVLTGLQVAKHVRAAGAIVRILVLSAYDDEHYIFELLKSGIAGYLTKDEAVDHIVDVVRGVARGETGWFSRNVMVKVAERGKEGGCSRRDALSEREKQILRLVAQGKINEEIAAILYITDGTVKNHITNVYRKLGVHTRTQAGTWAWKHGLMIDGVCGD